MQFFTKFGIDLKLLIAQIVNFSLLLFLLYKFLYKPLLNLLKERSQKIEQSLRRAEEIDQELKKIKKIREEKILQAQKEAYQLIKEAQAKAQKIKEEILSQTKQEINQARLKFKEEMKREKEKILEKAEKEIAHLVLLASQKILEEKWDQEKELKNVERILSQIKDV
jgi:F-type H+-transporting ATPase subunit b